MKKHELLKYAYNNYPKGTISMFGGKLPEHTSSGKFEITDLNNDGNIQVMSENGIDCFYADGKWAEIVTKKPSEVILFSGSEEVKVNLHGFSLANNSDVFFTDQELIKIYQAYQSLLPF